AYAAREHGRHDVRWQPVDLDQRQVALRLRLSDRRGRGRAVEEAHRDRGAARNYVVGGEDAAVLINDDAGAYTRVRRVSPRRVARDQHHRWAHKSVYLGFERR